jgi:CIC family chloride channel protein
VTETSRPKPSRRAPSLAEQRAAILRGTQAAVAMPGELVRTAPAYVRWLRGRVRESEVWLLVVAVGLGLAAGGATHLLAQLSFRAHEWLFGVDMGERLSSEPSIPLWRLIWLPVGGLVLGGVSWAWKKRRPNPIVDPVEANALRGGQMSLTDSLFLTLQASLSNGVGASVGLEAAYAQIGSGIASAAGSKLKARRSDMRILTGAGAGAAIAAAFGAPLTGAFYAFELIVGSYTVANVAPIVGAALGGYLVSEALGGVPHLIEANPVTLTPGDYIICAGLGVVAAIAGVGVMRLVNLVEVQTNRGLPRWLQPAFGGLVVAAMAAFAPEVLASGHGALERHLTVLSSLKALALIFLLKAVASAVSIGSGFRGGLFFASLFLGALLGQAYWIVLSLLGVHPLPDVLVTALVGMAAMAAGIVGGPLTMSFLVLESTGDFPLAGATLAATLVCSLMVREFFGYSFSTWRFHLRGETIRSAHDVGRIRSLTAGSMMRKNVPTIAASSTIAEFRRRFPLGSSQRVILVGDTGIYAGLVLTADAYGSGADETAPVSGLARLAERALRPSSDIRTVMTAFEASGGDELAVTDADGQVLGLVTETYAARRYAEELEKTRQELTGES